MACCSDSRRINSELSTSEASIGLPLWSISLIRRALDSASDFSARALLSWVLISPICWLDSEVLLVPMKRLDFERKASTRCSASATFLRRFSISFDSQLPADFAWSWRAPCCNARYASAIELATRAASSGSRDWNSMTMTRDLSTA